MKDNTIQSWWEKFEHALLLDQSEQRRYQSRIIFFAGASAILRMQSTLGEANVSEEIMQSIVANWYKEQADLTDDMLQTLTKMKQDKKSH